MANKPKKAQFVYLKKKTHLFIPINSSIDSWFGAFNHDTIFKDFSCYVNEAIKSNA